MKRIEITVSPTGETSLQTFGFRGSACQQASEFLEKALGKSTSEQLTPDYRLATTQTHESQVHNRPAS